MREFQEILLEFGIVDLVKCTSWAFNICEKMTLYISKAVSGMHMREILTLEISIVIFD